ncbi:hypothetical protein GOP47_0017963 [Adiantum capillus-veneris]|uniref:C2 domain-containing protein n=1 Tax=Adiantum capillus-veneris TaxID=13818 RepID=A0A9D4ZBC6_ADICA|nr:hypothetical protein GOP47_0017963 [Adiantum capillus-veneris]
MVASRAVIGCNKLKDTEWLSRQDPYVVLEYAGTRYRTKTDTDGGRNPTFNEKYMLPLIEGLREIILTVWNSNTVSTDDFIGSGKILLQKALTDGYDDTTWPLTTRSGKRSGEVRIIMHYTGPRGKQNSSAPTAPPVPAPSQPSGHAGYPPAYPAYPPAGNSPYCPYPPPGNTSYGGARIWCSASWFLSTLLRGPSASLPCIFVFVL